MKALAIAAGIVFWTLVLGTAWLAFFPAGEAEEPVAILQIEPAPEAPESSGPDGAPAPAGPLAAEPEPPEQTAEDGVDLPPGFGLPPSTPQAPMVQPPGPGGAPLLPVAPGGDPDTPGAPDDAVPPAGDDRQGAAPADPAMQQAALDAPAEMAAALPPPPPPPPIIPESETGSITLPPVPVADLVEESQYGPLPKIAADGRRPIDVYSRPSRYAVANPGDPPRIAILVTGLGLPNGPQAEVIEGLPPAVSVAYGAYGRSLQDGVSQVRADGHEVILQIPLEPDNYPTQDPGPHTLLTSLPAEDNLKRLQWLMSRYTGYVGVADHMGAKFETSAESLQPVLEEIKRRGLLYVDIGGQPGSTASQIASSLGIDYSVAGAEIDGDVAQQLAQLEAAAKQQGAVIGVATAKPATVKQIADWAKTLEAKGIVLVPVSAVVRAVGQG